MTNVLRNIPSVNELLDKPPLRKLIDRANRARWQQEGSTTIGQRAHDIVERKISETAPLTQPNDVRQELIERMRAKASSCGMERLPGAADE